MDSISHFTVTVYTVGQRTLEGLGVFIPFLSLEVILSTASCLFLPVTVRTEQSDKQNRASDTYFRGKTIQVMQICISH